VPAIPGGTNIKKANSAFIVDFPFPSQCDGEPEQEFMLAVVATVDALGRCV
jgi:hypothetical protein